ncbi:hypothetical protein EDC01DRAFT_377807 [Geopyxis carbonaria]|nr:hypothetical protein EDC01DRAFT_377807 [Geopyxis carbonaria]
MSHPTHGSAIEGNGFPEQMGELTPAEKFRNNAESKALEDQGPLKGRETRKEIDLSSVEAFPSLAGTPKAGVVPATWGARTNPATAFTEQQIEAPVSTWAPKIAGSVTAAQQTLHELTRENKRPASELRQPHADIIKDIQKRTGTKIDCAVYKDTGATVYIILGPEANRFKAKREINKELAAKIVKKLTIPAVIRPFIIGKQGAKIQELQTKTSTNIEIPRSQPADIPSGEYEDDAVIEITIEGDNEGCAEAARLIQNISNEKIIKITRRITCPGEFYPFVQGPFSRNVEHYETQVDKVIVPDYFFTSTPPPTFSSASGPIQVIGEKKAVEAVVAEIECLINEIRAAKYTFTPVEVGTFYTQLFTMHKGRMIHEIREETGCTVIAPPPGVPVPKVYIYGPVERRGEASNAVYRKIDNYKVATLDVSKPFSNAPMGAKVHARNIVRHLRRRNEIHAVEKECDIGLTFPSDEALNDLSKPCNVSIIGKSLENVNKAKAQIISIFGSYKPERFAYHDVEPLHHKHIIGKDGKGAKKISVQTSVELLFPEDPEEQQIVLIYEGSAEDPNQISAALEETKIQISEVLKGQAVIHTKVLPIAKEFHSLVRGDNGTTLNALNFGSVFVHFGVPKIRPGRATPSTSDQTEDTITLRGPPANVDATAKNIMSFVAATKNGSPEVITETFEYPKQYSGNLIGQKGANINRYRDELGVDIKLMEGNGEMKGIRVCVDAAKKKLFSQIKELEDKAVLTVKVPQQYHSNIIGSEGSTVRRLEDRYHVRINFPKAGRSDDNSDGASAKQALDEIIIRGSKKEAEEARQEITDLWKYEAENSHTETISVAARAVGYMFKNASKDINQLRDEFAVRIVIPPEDKTADPTRKIDIKIRGKKEGVNHAKAVLAKIAATAENTTTRMVSVDKKFHRSLIGAGGQTLRSIVVGAGGPDDRAALARMVRFPNQGSDSDEIAIHGNVEVVDKIIAAIQGIVAEKAKQVSIQVDVAPEKHRKLIGREGSTRRDLESRFKVTIDIPRQRPSENASSEVKITGLASDVDIAKQHILQMVQEPDGETIQVPTHLHHAIADGGFFKQLHSKFKVSVDHNGQPRPPKPEEPKSKVGQDLPLITDEVAEDKVLWEIVEKSSSEDEATYPWTLRGSPDNVEKAKNEIEKAIKAAKNQSFVGLLILPDPRKYRFVVGPGGATVDRIRRDTGCRITVPRNQAVGEAIVLHGDKEGLEKAKNMIIEIVRK